MPRTKFSKGPDKMTVLIRGYYPTYTALAEILDCTIPTAKVKMENPSKLTITDLHNLCRTGHIGADEIKAAITL